MLKPVPLGAIDEMVIAVSPLLLSVSGRVLLDPVATLPKLKVVGFALRVPAETPVPERAMLYGVFLASLTIANVPVVAPVACGANFTDTVAL
jgi:hypothetical protein